MKEFFSINLEQFSLVNIFGLIFLGGMIYVVTGLFKNYLVHFIIKSPVRRKKVISKLPVVYSLVWILFFMYSFYVFIKPFPFYGVIVSLVFIYLGRVYLMNLIHGLFFRLKGNIELGQKTSIEEHEGIVVKMNSFDVEIENKEGELIQIPYSNLARKEIVKKDFSSDFTVHKFSVVLPNEVNEQIIKRKLIAMPWVTTVFKPKVNKTMQSEGTSSYSILVYALDEKYHVQIENDLKTGLLNQK